MNKRILFSFGLALIPVLLFAGVVQKREETVLAFTHATVIDATGAPAKPDMTVIIANGRINVIGKTSRTPLPAGAQEINSTGKFIIPGLWDMHIHSPDAGPSFPLFIANGVTGVREMLGFPPEFDWRKALQNVISPHVVVARFFGVVENDEVKARQAIRDAKAQGVDFIKVIEVPSREIFFAIADEAKKQRIPFAGHVSPKVRLTEASDAGQKSVEHLTGMVFEASTNEDRVRQQCIDSKTNEQSCAAMMEATDTFDAKKAAAIYKRLVRNHTWQVPTLRMSHNYWLMNDPAIANEPSLKYVSAAMRTRWNSMRESLMKQQTANQWADSNRRYQQALKIVGDMHRAGVPLLAGTDIMNPFLVPGFSLHEELALLVEAGLTPMEALQTATRNAAEYFGTLKSEGTIEKGKRADLVMLDANPLTNIRNTQKISGVMLGGKYYDRPALDKMLTDVERLANAK